MSLIPKPQEIYKHFKGNLYQIITIAKHSENGEQLVIYQALYGDFGIYARPLELFTQRVDKNKYPEAAQEYRFEKQEQSSGESEQSFGEPKQPSAGSLGEPKQPILDPMLYQFLDADSYGERLNILAGLRHRITDEMITTMAIACDVEVGEGDLMERYESLKSCLLTLDRFECTRLR